MQIVGFIICISGTNARHRNKKKQNEMKIVLDSIYFLNYSCVLSPVIPVLCVVVAATFCGFSDSTNLPGEEQVYFFVKLNLAISCQLGPQIVVTAYTVALKSKIGSYRCDSTKRGTKKICRS